MELPRLLQTHAAASSHAHHAHRPSLIRMDALSAPVETMQQKAGGGEMQHQIYFWNIQIQRLQHTSEGSWNTWNMLMKHLKYTPETHLKTIATHTQHPNKTHATSK
jgi:hypothetical protein